MPKIEAREYIAKKSQGSEAVVHQFLAKHNANGTIEELCGVALDKITRKYIPIELGKNGILKVAGTPKKGGYKELDIENFSALYEDSQKSYILFRGNEYEVNKRWEAAQKAAQRINVELDRWQYEAGGGQAGDYYSGNSNSVAATLINIMGFGVHKIGDLPAPGLEKSILHPDSGLYTKEWGMGSKSIKVVDEEKLASEKLQIAEEKIKFLENQNIKLTYKEKDDSQELKYTKVKQQAAEKEIELLKGHNLQKEKANSQELQTVKNEIARLKDLNLQQEKANSQKLQAAENEIARLKDLNLQKAKVDSEKLQVAEQKNKLLENQIKLALEKLQLVEQENKRLENDNLQKEKDDSQELKFTKQKVALTQDEANNSKSNLNPVKEADTEKLQVTKDGYKNNIKGLGDLVLTPDEYAMIFPTAVSANSQSNLNPIKKVNSKNSQVTGQEIEFLDFTGDNVNSMGENIDYSTASDN